MPTELSVTDGVIYTRLFGRVTDDELLSHYQSLETLDSWPPAWRELVDGRQISDMAITVSGQQRLAGLIALHIEKVRGGKVAMVASSELVYGMFRMWELRREELPYQVEVFREMTAALDWLREP